MRNCPVHLRSTIFQLAYHMPTSNSLAEKTTWSAAASSCNMFGRFIVQIMIARMLGPDGVGRIAYIVWLIEITNLLTCFGFPGSLTRYLAELKGQNRSDEASDFARWIFMRYLMMTLLGSVVIGVLYYHSSQYSESQSIFALLIVLFFARGLETINRAHLAGLQRFDRLARINVISTVMLVAGVAVGASLHGISGALYGYIAGTLVPAVYSFTILKDFTFLRKVKNDLLQRVWKFSFYGWLAMLVSAFVWSRMEIFFLERYWDAREVAMFTVALTFGLMVNQVAQLFSGAFLAHFSLLTGQGNDELVQRQYSSATRLMAFMIIPLSFGGAAIMPVLLPLLFGPEFTQAVPNAMVLTATSALAFSLIGSALVYAKERSRFIALGGLAGAALSIAAGFLIVSRFGAWGAVWCRLFVQCSMIGLGVWYITHRLHFSFPFMSIGRNLLAGTFCGLAAWWAVRFAPGDLLSLCIAVPLGAFVYGIGVKWFWVLGPDEVGHLRKFVKRLPLAIHKPFVFTLDSVVRNS